MKLWTEYGSEHSANLVMIGTFKDATTAKQVKDKIDALTEQVQKEMDDKGGSKYPNRFSDEMMKLLEKVRFHSVGPGELEQFAYDANVAEMNGKIRIDTDEIEVSAFLKLLIDNGAKVEVYSAHDYSSEGK
jgi:hypothetical protein